MEAHHPLLARGRALALCRAAPEDAGHLSEGSHGAASRAAGRRPRAPPRAGQASAAGRLLAHAVRTAGAATRRRRSPLGALAPRARDGEAIHEVGRSRVRLVTTIGMTPGSPRD